MQQKLQGLSIKEKFGDFRVTIFWRVTSLYLPGFRSPLPAPLQKSFPYKIELLAGQWADSVPNCNQRNFSKITVLAHYLSGVLENSRMDLATHALVRCQQNNGPIVLSRSQGNVPEDCGFWVAFYCLYFRKHWVYFINWSWKIQRSKIRSSLIKIQVPELSMSFKLGSFGSALMNLVEATILSESVIFWMLDIDFILNLTW